MANVKEFIKKNLSVSYSAILLIIIPILMIVNTIWFATSSNRIFQNEILNLVSTRESLIAANLADTIYSNTILNERINNLTSFDPTIKEISILKQERSTFKVASSSTKEIIGQSITTVESSAAWSEGKVYRSIINNKTGKYALSYIPIQNSTKQSVAIIKLKTDLSIIEANNQANKSNILLIAFVIIFFTILLLASQFKMLEYAVGYKKLEEIDKMKDDFISIATHELKTPMTGIKGYISMLIEGSAGKVDSSAIEHLQKVLLNVDRLDNLIEELLDVSRIEQKRIEFNIESIDFGKIYQEVSVLLAPEATAKKIFLKLELPKTQPKILADANRLKQVLNNIIGNAIKYTTKGGVTVSMEQSCAQYAQIIIKDTGIGIAEKDQNKLFGKFYRIKNEQTQDISGTGLGLWISRELIRSMRGEITVESKEGIGSVFKIKLPIIKG